VLDFSALQEIREQARADGMRVKMMPFVYSVLFGPLASGTDNRTIVFNNDPFVWCSTAFEMREDDGDRPEVIRPVLAEIVRARTSYRCQSAPLLVSGGLAGRLGRAQQLARKVYFEPAETVRFNVENLGAVNIRMTLSLIGVRLMPC